MPSRFSAAALVSMFAMSIVLGACSKDEGKANLSYDSNGSPVAEVKVEAADASVEPTAASTTDGAAPVDPFEAPITADGWGLLKIGMSYDDAMAVFGVGPGSDIAESEGCRAITPRGAPDGLQIMFENGALSRVSLTGFSPLRTDRGFGLGDRGDDVLRAYGSKATKSRHKDPPPSMYIDVWKGGAPKASPVKDPNARGVRYEVGANRKVVSILAGGPSIQNIKGCG